MRNTLILAAIAALAFSSAANAKSCKDDHGKFVKCPPAAAAPVTRVSNKAGPGTCKDAKGHFAKCGTVAAIPAHGTTAVATTKTTSGGLFGPKTTTTAVAATTTGGSPHCNKGKPCGHSCIAMDKVCHK
jgi:hypothetical protein